MAQQIAAQRPNVSSAQLSAAITAARDVIASAGSAMTGLTGTYAANRVALDKAQQRSV